MMKKMLKNPWGVAGMMVAVMVVLSTVFHYPVRIIDALTLEPQADFSIRISIWRVLFEPVVGLLLYFNRALYPLNEIVQLLPWFLIIFFALGIRKGFVIKREKGSLKGFALRQLANLPLIFGLWFTLFVVLIFVPLPNNTIVNKNPDRVLVTTHSHTEWSHDGLISQKRLWEWHRRNGFDAFFITDHNNHDHTLDFKEAQRNGAFPMEPLVMCGEEFSGSNHLSLLGLQHKFSTHGLPDSTVVDTVRNNGGAVIVNHWFDGQHNTMAYYRDLGVDGFEIENTATDRAYDRKVYEQIKAFAKENNLILNGGLDFHGYGNVCSLWNAFDIPGWHRMTPEDKERSILNIIRNRDQARLSVLLYHDRAYYENKNLFFRPVITFFNYFRTLNPMQVLSWALWVALFVMIKRQFSHTQKAARVCRGNVLLPLAVFAGSLLMLGFGIFYHMKIAEVAGSDNDIYLEYSHLFFMAGGILLLYSMIILYFRIIRKNTGQGINH